MWSSLISIKLPKKIKNIAIRFSEDESIETVSKYINKLDYVWIDTFTKFPINKKNNKILNNFPDV